MKTLVGILAWTCVVSCATWAAEPAAGHDEDWPQWRGLHANGVAPHADPPVEWSESKNVKWKVEIPGKGHASPIVWGDRVFILTAIETDKPGKSQQSEGGQTAGRRGPPTTNPSHVLRFTVLAIDRADGKTLWQRALREELPHEGIHTTGSWASNSPITDGEHVYAYFGSRGLYCLDMQGNLEWKKDLGDMSTRRGFGEGSSPVIQGDRLVINWDHEGQSFLIALDKKTGEELWRVNRDEPTSWSTPLVVESGGSTQVVVSATNRVRGHDPQTGKLIWECGGMTTNAIPTPVAANGLVYVMSGFRGNALRAIRLAAAKGDITDSAAIAWKYDTDTPYTPSPLLYEDMLCFLKGNAAVLTCLNPKTGGEHFSRQRLDGIEGVYASLVGGRDHFYVVGRNGTAAVVKHAPEFEVLAENTLEDGFSASPAIVGDEIYLRGHKYLYCIAEE
jgi:outer membrane protein assembly factor BamB